MRDHGTCEDAINAALARGNDGRAEYLATRCDLEHGELVDHCHQPHETEPEEMT